MFILWMCVWSHVIACVVVTKPQEHTDCSHCAHARDSFGFQMNVTELHLILLLAQPPLAPSSKNASPNVGAQEHIMQPDSPLAIIQMGTSLSIPINLLREAVMSVARHATQQSICLFLTLLNIRAISMPC